MVDDMEFGNVLHQVLAIKIEFAVDGCGGAFQEFLSLRLVSGNVGVRMVEVDDGYDPVLYPYVRHHVQQSDSFQSDLCSCVPESDQRQANTSVGGQDEMLLFRTKQRTGR